MSYNSNVTEFNQEIEYSKFVRLENDSRFPPVSVTRLHYPDTTFNGPGLNPLSSTQVYPKYAVLTYNTGGIGGAGIGGSFTKCETRTSGNPSFTPVQILIHNDSNSTVDVGLTLVSGMSCTIPVGKNTTANHIVTLNLAVSAINNYAGTEIVFFA